MAALPASILPGDPEPSGSSDLPQQLRHQKRFMRRLKRKPLAVDFWQPDSSISTVTNVKIDSGLDSVRSRASAASSGATSISVSWRHSLNSILDRISNASRHSTTSGTTFVYEDVELPQNPSIPQLYCSIVQVGSQSIKDRRNTSDVRVSPQIHVLPANSPDVTITSINVENETDDNNNTDSVIISAVDDNATEIGGAIVQPSEPQGRPTIGPSSSDPLPPIRERRFDHSQSQIHGPGPFRFAAHPHHIPPHSSGHPPPHFGPFFVHEEAARGVNLLPPHMMPPGFNPWNAASSPIELTGWRINSNFDPSPGENEGIMDSRRAQRNSDIANLHAGNLLVPEDLPHLLPDSGVSVPFARYEDELDEYNKGCCAWLSVDQETVLRCFIGVICLVGIACVMVGIVLGAVTVSGTTRLTLCLLLIGVGAVLLTVSAIAFRLTSVDPAARSSLLGFLGFRTLPAASTNPYYRVTSDHHINARPNPGFESGGFYPEFNWRPPPPSYQASVRDATLQQLFGVHPMSGNNLVPIPSGSPPPTYRSNVDTQRPTIQQVLHSGSRPPSYRSQDSLPTVTVTLDEMSASQPAPTIVNNEERTSEQCADFSDRRRLILDPTANFRPENAAEDSQNTSDRVSVIDCSLAVPVTFEVPPSETQIQEGGHMEPSRRRGPPRNQNHPAYPPGLHPVFPTHLTPLPPMVFMREGVDPRRFPHPRPPRPQMGGRPRNRGPPPPRGTSYV